MFQVQSSIQRGEIPWDFPLCRSIIDNFDTPLVGPGFGSTSPALSSNICIVHLVTILHEDLFRHLLDLRCRLETSVFNAHTFFSGPEPAIGESQGSVLNLEQVLLC